MTLNLVKLRRVGTCMKYLTSLVPLICQPKTLIWNKSTFRLSNSLNIGKLLVNGLTKSITTKI